MVGLLKLKHFRSGYAKIHTIKVTNAVVGLRFGILGSYIFKVYFDCWVNTYHWWVNKVPASEGRLLPPGLQSEVDFYADNGLKRYFQTHSPPVKSRSLLIGEHNRQFINTGCLWRAPCRHAALCCTSHHATVSPLANFAHPLMWHHTAHNRCWKWKKNVTNISWYDWMLCHFFNKSIFCAPTPSVETKLLTLMRQDSASFWRLTVTREVGYML